MIKKSESKNGEVTGPLMLVLNPETGEITRIYEDDWRKLEARFEAAFVDLSIYDTHMILRSAQRRLYNQGRAFGMNLVIDSFAFYANLAECITDLSERNTCFYFESDHPAIWADFAAVLLEMRTAGTFLHEVATAWLERKETQIPTVTIDGVVSYMDFYPDPDLFFGDAAA